MQNEKNIKITNLKDSALIEISKSLLLSLNINEMKAMSGYFKNLHREPTRLEVEIIAQTWSEHCKHKTMTGLIEYKYKTASGREGEADKWKTETIDNLLKETIFKTPKGKTHCLSVFSDNAGVITFDEDNAIAMKVETHNHPSAIEPYGGAATGMGGVIRDILGCGLGAKPVLNIDVFCFGRLDTNDADIPPGIFHPKRIFKGVVRGVSDYSNRMGIPTSSGAIIFDDGYLFNPIIYCGTIGIMPKKFINKKVYPGDRIVVIGGRTGRDGIHGATFSSAPLDEEVDESCVQLPDAITEKKFADVMLKIRDMGLFNAVTDCGAGGLSSAIGEMAASCGAEVHLEQVLLKYEGLKVWEIFLSEAQERMVLSVPPKNLDRVKEMLLSEDVEWADVGEWTNTKKLKILYNGKLYCDIKMDFLHNGMPRLKRKAIWKEKLKVKGKKLKVKSKELSVLFEKIISHPNVASKEVVISQYDHEVQGTSRIKPFAGAKQDVPQDGCVIRPFLDKIKGIAVGLGINPSYGRIDPYYMALSNCEEAVRNLVACGGKMKSAAFMDNFCAGDTNDAKILGGLVRAAKGCYDASKILDIPFVSGKDSLNNFYLKNGLKINIPQTLLISCISVVPYIKKIPGSNFKEPGNIIYLAGETYPELGGALLSDISDGKVPHLRKNISIKVLSGVERTMERGLLKACHDLSEGGLALAISEMTFSGIGADIDIAAISKDSRLIKLFSESNSRFLLEVEEKNKRAFEKLFTDIPFYKIGKTHSKKMLVIRDNGDIILKKNIDELNYLWKTVIKW